MICSETYRFRVQALLASLKALAKEAMYAITQGDTPHLQDMFHQMQAIAFKSKGPKVLRKYRDLVQKMEIKYSDALREKRHNKTHEKMHDKKLETMHEKKPEKMYEEKPVKMHDRRNIVKNDSSCNLFDALTHVKVTKDETIGRSPFVPRDETATSDVIFFNPDDEIFFFQPVLQ